jgi:hypothetical protein
MVCKILFGSCVGEQAQALGAEFGQNAIVWADADAVPQLISSMPVWKLSGAPQNA